MKNKVLFDKNGTSDENYANFADTFKKLMDIPGSTLVISPGIYEISTDVAKETQMNVLNGVYGDNPEKSMFDPYFVYSKGLNLHGLKNVTVEAHGVKLMVDGFMEPVSITNCENVTIKGLEIDHKRKPYSKGIIIETVFTDKVSGSGYMTVEFSADYPLSSSTPMPRACIFDCNAGRFAHYGEIKIELKNRTELSEQIWRFPFCNLFEDVTGNEMYVWHTFHSRPAVLIENSSNICLEDFSIYSQPGMGVVAHRCENLYFNRFRVIPSAGEHMSTNTDATHITSCKGTVEYSNCLFEGQGDDSVNIHTYYHRIIKTGKNTCRIYLDAPTGTHSQSADYPDEGDTLELTDVLSLDAVDTFKVVSCVNLNNRESDLVLDKPLPEICDGYFFADADHQPHFYFHDCLCRSHLARGVLTKTKYVCIENNRFIDVVGTAICVLAEGHWREGICTTREVSIRRNYISFCGRTNSIRQSGSGGITVGLCATQPDRVVHENVLITDNQIDCPHTPHAIYISNTQNLTLERNVTVSKSEQVKIEKYSEPDR